jgi:hypothetical protein
MGRFTFLVSRFSFLVWQVQPLRGAWSRAPGGSIPEQSYAVHDKPET